MEKKIYEKFLKGEISRAEVLRLVKKEERLNDEIKMEFSEGQKGLLTLYNMDTSDTSYNTPGAILLSKDVDIDVLKESLKYLVDFHQMLRANIKYTQSHQYQVISKENKLNVEEFYVENFSEDEIDELIWKKIKEPFDLENKPLVRAIIYHIKDGKKILLLNFHHIVFDGMSSEIFIRDLKKTYYDLLNNRNVNLIQSRKTYKDFIEWEKTYISSNKAEEDLAYWLNLLKGDIPKLKLSTKCDYSLQNETKVSFINLESSLVEALKKLDINTHVSLFSLMIAAYTILLSKYGKQKEILIGTPILRREDKEFENLIGYFINTVVIKCNINNSITVNDFIVSISNKALDGFEHGNYPYYKLLREFNSRNKRQTLELFQSGFYFQNYMQDESDGVFLKPLNKFHQLGEADLILEVINENGGLTARIKYNSNLYEDKIIDDMLLDYKNILKAFTEHDIEKLSISEVLGDEFKEDDKEIMNEENFKSFVNLFEEKVKEYPNETAVIFHDSKLTYEELYNKCKNLVLNFKENNVERGDIVGVFLERSLDLIVALIAVQMAGATYVPLDPEYPKDRLEYMFTESKMKFLVSKEYLNKRVENFTHNIINIDKVRKFEKEYIQSYEPIKLSGEDIAYVIFTSGSTGKPKGIMVKHQGLYNFIISMRKEPGCTKNDYLLALTTICFDIAGLEMYLPLISGAKLEILDESMARDGIELLDKFENSEVTIMQATPATWQMLLAAGWDKQKNIKALCGGEALTDELAEKLTNLCDEVWNMYGPTETTIWSSVCNLKPGEEVSIGHPIDNTDFYILDENLKPVPEESIGELYIGGLGVAKGYMNNEKENKKKFIKDIFSSNSNDIMYRTGDLVKRNTNGLIKYIGRVDFQVKINGFRIELGEIEKVLEGLEEIERAVVVAKGDSSDSKYLVAFLIARDENNLPSSEYIKTSIKKKLSDYMVPVKYVFLKEYPLTLNKKVDRKKLANEKISALVNEYVENLIREDTEGDIVQSSESELPLLDFVEYTSEFVKKCISEIKSLEIKDVDTNTYISEYGFDSISFTTLSVKINKHFGVKINPTIFYTYQKITDFSEFLYKNFRKQVEETIKKENIMIVQKSKPKVLKNSEEDKKVRNKYTGEIAIIGMSGIFPKAANLDEFWDNLLNKKDCISEVPIERWDWKKFYNEADDSSNKITSKWSGFIDDADKFDAKFFNISPREAELMDPQQRCMMQVVWNLFENSGYKPSDLAESNTGVFIGATSNDYSDILFRDSNIESHSITGVSNNIIPNRISYFFNFNGPSELIDTACSSALTSVCRAVNSIRTGECDMAIAGGVNILMTPFPYIALGKSNMLCKDGRCKTFDESANGYVRGEAAAAILCKPLDKAYEDKDNIYAVIKGTAINHGGKTNSLTAPNPNAERDLIKSALKDADTDLSTIGYIETHGTGTALGDPIEINALNMVYNDEEKHECTNPNCVLGSVKTNIGHTEAVAGLVGLIKSVLSVYNKKIVPNINFSKLNPYINLENSPFSIADKDQNWPVLLDKKSEKIPLRAGVSSFGFGGSNAHVIIEEFSQINKDDKNNIYEEFVILLSAKYKEGLKLRAVNLVKYLEKDTESDNPSNATIKQIAYTLANGREHMKERVALIVNNKDELKHLLKEFISGVKADKIIMSEKRGEDINCRAQDKKLLSVAIKWVQGEDIDWSTIYDKKNEFKVALPGYSFKKDRYWVGRRWNKYSYGRNKNVKPFIEDTIPEKSLSNGIVFKKTLTNSDLILRDHVVAGKSIFPATGYLEMILEAAKIVKPNSNFKLTDIFWKKGLIVEDDNVAEVNIELKTDEENMTYEIKSLKDNVEEAHSRGRIIVKDNTAEEEDHINVSEIEDRCPKIILNNEFYTWLAGESGIEYGEYFRGIKKVNIGIKEALAEISLPDRFSYEKDEYYCHPVFMDCALQTMACLFGQSEDKGITKIPFSVEEVNIIKLLKDDDYYVHVKNVRKNVHDIFILNLDGEKCIEFKNVSSAEIKDNRRSDFYKPKWQRIDIDRTTNSVNKNSLVLYSEDSIKMKESLEEVLNSSEASEVNLYESYSNNLEEIIKNSIKKLKSIDNIYFISSLVNENVEVEDIEVVENKQKMGLYAFFYLVKVLGAMNKNVTITLVTNNIFEVIDGENIIPINAGLVSFIKTAMLEYPKLNIVLIDTDYSLTMSKVELDEKVSLILSCSSNKVNNELAIRGNEVYIRQFENIALSNFKETPYKHDGVYVIAGMGGISYELGKDIAKKVRANLIFISRSELNKDRQDKIDEINKLGSRAEYIQVDLIDEDEVKDAIDYIKNKYGRINGVFQSALVLDDKMLHNMTEDVFRKVNLPKVEGSITLYKAIRNEKLDFFMFFSSINSIIGNIGQSNYNAACAFQDSFARYIQQKVNFDVKVINWSYWGTVGAVVSEKYRTNMKKEGIYPIEIADGIKSIELTIKSPFTQVIMFKATKELLNKVDFKYNLESLSERESIPLKIQNIEKFEMKKDVKFERGIEKNHVEEVDTKQGDIIKVTYMDNEIKDRDIESHEHIDENVIISKVKDYLIKKVCASLKLKREDIDTTENFDSLGIDSMVIIELSKELALDFEKVPSTIFFEYNTIEELAKYFTENYRDKCIEIFDLKKESEANVKEDSVINNTDFDSNTVKEEIIIEDKNTPTIQKKIKSSDIAIIGISGRYPMSENLDEYWLNLINGKNCIEEVPKDRWDWRKYYDPENLKQGHGYSKWAGFIKDVDKFDAEFFGIDKEKANEMDPQERICLENVWSTLEDAGYPGDTLSKNGYKVGVFLGTMYGYYGQIATEMWRRGVRTNAQSAYWIIPNRISHYFNFTGPSLVIDTACSSSLTSIHYACNSIRLQECDVAIAGGINLILHPRQHVRLANIHSIGKTHKSYSFSKNADGYIEGEGVGTVLLKSLDDAIRDKDYIYGVIRGSSINSGGNTSKFTAPSIAAQAEVIESTFKKADIDCKTINYVEAHATGTVLGDPIEVRALDKVYKKYTDKKQFCPIGTIKSNIGHLEAASGISALTKVLLQMKHKKMVPSINCEELNEFIDFENSQFYLLNKATPWEPSREENSNDFVRRATISSFGAGGANAFVVVDEYDNNNKSFDDGSERLVVISAKTKNSIKKYVTELLKFIDVNKEDISLADIAFTLQTCRSEMKERLAIKVRSLEELVTALNNVRCGLVEDNIFAGTVNKKLSNTVIDADNSLDEIARLWVRGQYFDWNLLYKNNDNKPHHIPIPTYSFDRKRYWIDDCTENDPENIDLGEEKEVLISDTYKYEEPYIRDHNSFSKRTLLGLTYCSMVYEGLNKTDKDKYVHLHNFLFVKSAEVNPGKEIKVNIELNNTKESSLIQCEYKDTLENDYEICATGEIIDDSNHENLSVSIPSFENAVSGEKLYSLKPDVYKSSLQSIKKIVKLGDLVWSQLSLDEQLINDNHNYLVHPALLDSAILSRLALKDTDELDSFIPMMIKELYIYKSLGIDCYSKLEQVKINSEIWEVNVDVYDKFGQLAVSMKGAVCKKVWVDGEQRSEEHQLNKTSKVENNKDIDMSNPKYVFEEYLTGLVASKLKIEKDYVNKDENIMAMGIDSMSLVSLAQNIEKEFSIKLYPTIFFEYQTINEVVKFITDEYQEALSKCDFVRKSAVTACESLKLEEDSITIDVENDNKEELILQNYLVEKMAYILKEEKENIDIDKNIMSMGIDSMNLVSLAKDLEEKFKIKLYPTVFFEYQTISEFVNYIVNEYGDLLNNVEVQNKYDIQHIENHIKKSENESIIKREAVVQKNKANKDIAIIGMSAVMPQSNDLDDFWEKLKNQECLITEVPKERWDWRDYAKKDNNEKDKTNVRWGGFIKDVDKFDPEFFGLSPREAKLMDPQQRITLELAWKVIEDAGYNPKDFSGSKTGVFIGVAGHDYDEIVKKSNIESYAQALTGNAHNVLTGRISYLLNLKGPGEPIDTACASSIVAINNAIKSIENNECEMAIAGGVNVTVTPSLFIAFDNAGILSHEGKCKTFDKDADGTVRGEGAGLILLKPLDKAIEDKDNIYAVIKGTAVNHAGSSSSLTAPNPKQQSQVIVDAIRKSNVDPSTISYIEAHGTGTKLGDPIEINSLKNVFKEIYKEWPNADFSKKTCAIGSVKANIGHLETAAGIAGIIKIILAMKHKCLPALVNFKNLNPYIELDDTPFYILTSTKKWERVRNADNELQPYRAGISSFGFSGTNAHLILEEYIEQKDEKENNKNKEYIVCLSAKKKESLMQYAKLLSSYLKKNNKSFIGDNNQYKKSIIERDVIEYISKITSIPVKYINTNNTLEECGINSDSFNDFLYYINNTYSINTENYIFTITNSLEEIIDIIYEKNEQLLTSEEENKQLLKKISYVFHNGRDVMKHRLAIVAEDCKQLKEKLDDFIEGKDNIDGIYFNCHNQILQQDNKYHQGAFKWVQDGKLESWESIYNEKAPRKIHLPSYPFIKKRYWVDEKEMQPKVIKENKSTEELACNVAKEIEIDNIVRNNKKLYKKNLNKNLFYLRDHMVNGKHILPGVMYLELVRRIAERSTLDEVKEIKNVVWAEPIVVENSDKETIIELSEEKEHLIYKVRNREGKVYSKGKLELGKREKCSRSPIDVKEIRNRCNKSLSHGEFYKLFETVGFKYGNTFKPVKNIYFNDNEAISEIEVPEELKSTFNKYFLHPSLLEGALQTAGYLANSKVPPQSATIPFEVESLKIYEKLETKCYFYAVLDKSTNESKLKKISGCLVNEEGRILLVIKNYIIREAEKKPSTQYLTTHWINKNITTKYNKEKSDILLFDIDEVLFEKLKKNNNKVILVKPGSSFKCINDNKFELKVDSEADYVRLIKYLIKNDIKIKNIVHMWSQIRMSTLQNKLKYGIYSLFNLSKAILKNFIRDKKKLLYLYTEEDPAFEAVSGFVKSLNLESKNIEAKVIGLDNLKEVETIILNELKDNTNDVEIKYTGNQRKVKKMKLTNLMKKKTVVKNNGVYLITGGLGKIGLSIAKYLIKKYNAKIVLCGRSQMQLDDISILPELRSNILYVKGDITQIGDIENIISKIESVYKRVDGIINCAGISKDSLIINKNIDDFKQVIETKVLGTKNIYEAVWNKKLDFIVFFSSISGEIGNLGQADYAYANSYMDYYSYDNSNSFINFTSINWPLWVKGTIGNNESTKRYMKNRLDLVPLSNEEGFEILEKCLSANEQQVFVLHGGDKKLDALFNKEDLMSEKKINNKSNDKEIIKSIIQELTKVVSSISNIEEDDISLEEDITNYGFDSIVMIEFAEKMSTIFDLEITPALFYELSVVSIENIASKLYEKFNNNFDKFYGRENEIVEEVHQDNFDYEDDSDEEEIIEDDDNEEVYRHENYELDNETEANNYDGIAIIGMSGIMPQSKNLNEFWKHLEQGDNLITEVPENRWDYKKYYGDPLQGGNKTLCKWGGFIDDIDKFDASFFHISPQEAKLLDPQQRKFLEVVWKTIEDAGYKASSIKGTDTGVFVGVTNNEYEYLVDKADVSGDGHLISSNAHFLLSNKVSYYFDFRGPSETVDTACSSTGVALHRAICSIKNGECNIAVVGGVNALLSPLSNSKFDSAGMLSRTGSCKSFDKNADGFVRGEGIGAILLKPLSKAIEDNDNIHAVIRGSAVNHNGTAKSFTAPNPQGQTDVIKKAIKNSKVDPLTIGYVEAQSTGSYMGDIIEVEALNEAFNQLVEDNEKYYGSKRCAIGSVKSNIGHLEAASGIASILKVILAMENKVIPPTVNCKEINPNIKLNKSEFYIASEKSEWKQLRDENGEKVPRRAGISIFGAGGVNTQIILEEFNNELYDNNTDEVEKDSIMIFSARSKESLNSIIKDTMNYVKSTTEVNLRDIAYTLQIAREEMEERAVFIVKDKDDFINKVADFLEDKHVENVFYKNIEDKNTDVYELFQDNFMKDSMIENIINNKQYYKIAKLWLNDVLIDWQKLYEGEKRAKVVIPTYSFKKDRYWLDIKDESQEIIEEELPTENETDSIQEESLDLGIEEEVKSEMSELLGCSVKNEDFLACIGFDSIIAIKFKYKIEKKYSISIPLADIGKCKTVKNILNIISDAVNLSLSKENEADVKDIMETNIEELSDIEMNSLYEELERKIMN